MEGNHDLEELSNMGIGTQERSVCLGRLSGS